MDVTVIVYVNVNVHLNLNDPRGRVRIRDRARARTPLWAWLTSPGRADTESLCRGGRGDADARPALPQGIGGKRTVGQKARA